MNNKEDVQSNMSKEDLETYFYVNRKMIQLYGLEKSCILAYLIDIGWKDNNLSKAFICTNKMIMDDLRVSEDSVRKCKKFFREQNILDTKLAGLPAKEYYTVNVQKLIKILL
jgi:hypothetical protein